METLESRQLLAAELVPEPDAFVSLYDYDGNLLSNWQELVCAHGATAHDHDHDHDHHDHDHDHDHDTGLQLTGTSSLLASDFPSFDGGSSDDPCSPNCYMPTTDPETPIAEEFDARYSWPQPGGLGSAVTISFSFSNLFDGGLGGSLTEAQLRAAAQEALGLWATYAPLNFVEVTDSGPAVSDDTSYLAGTTPDIRIGHHSFDGSSGTLAHAYYPSSTYFGISGDTHMDAAENWKLGAGGGIDIVEVFTHEFGHALGLGHSSASAIMGATYGSRFSGLGTGFLLQDDIDGIRALYGTGVGSVTPLNPPANSAPTLAPISDVNMLSTTNSVDVTLVGADADGDPLTYTATLVTGAGLAGASDVSLSVSGNVITVDPASNFTGTIRVQAAVSDGEFSANRTFDVIVTVPNNAPTLAAVSDVNMLSTTNSVDVSLAGADADGDPLTYTATLVTDAGLAGASDVSLSVSGHVITVDPASNFSGTIRVQAAVSDGQDSANRTFDVIVTAPNNAPTLAAVSDVNMLSTTNSVDVSLVGADADGDPLTYTATLVTGAGLAGASDVSLSVSGNVITVDPASNFSGTIRVQAAVSDGEDSASRTFDVIVTTPNNAPTLAAVSDVNMLSTTNSVDVSLVGADADGDPLTYTATLVTGAGLAGASDVSLSVSGNVITVDPASNFTGTIRVQAAVSDGADSASRTFDVIVSGPNNAPTITSVPDQTVSASAGSFSLAINASDTDGDALSYWGEAIEIDTDQATAFALKTALGFRAAGSEYFNSRGLSDKWFYGTGNAWHYILPSGNIHRWGGSIAASPLIGSVNPSYHADLSTLLNVTEPTGTPLPGTYTWSGNTMTVDYPDSFVGNFNVNVRVSDGLESATTSFSVTVTNSAPVITDISDQTLSHSEGSRTLTVGASDADGDSIAYSAAATLADPVSTLAYDLQQQHQFRALANDAYNYRGLGEKYFVGDGSQYFYMLAQGQIYRWGGSIAASTLVGTLDSTYHADLNKLFNAQEPLQVPADATLSWSGSQLTIDPASNFLGTFNVTVTASDGVESDSTSFLVSVVNNAPVVTAVADQAVSPGSSVFTLAIDASDADGDTLNYWGEAVQIDADQAAAYALKTAHSLRAAANDYENYRGAGEKYFYGEGSKWFYMLPDGGIYRFRANLAASQLVGTVDPAYHSDLNSLFDLNEPTATPLGTSYTWSGNQMSVGIPNGFDGTFDVNVRVSDGLESATTSFTVEVRNSAPVIGDVPTQTMSYTLDSVTIPLVISDPDGQTLTRTATATQIDPTAQLAYSLDQQHQFRALSNEAYNYRGVGEKYFVGDGSQYFYILPQGEIYRWRGSIAASTLLATLDSTYHADLSLLLNAQQPTGSSGNATVSWSGNQLTIDPADGFFGTLNVAVSVSDGIDTTVETFDLDVTSSPPVVANVPDQVINSGQNSISVSVTASDADGDALTFDAEAVDVDPVQQNAYDLNQAHQFRLAGNGYFNARGLSEKYMFGDGSQWFYILPSGEIYRWQGTIAASTLVGTLDSSYHADPNLLFNAQQPVSNPIDAGLAWSGNTLTINRPAGYAGTFDVTLRVTAGGETVTQTFAVTVAASGNFQAPSMTEPPQLDPSDDADTSADIALLASVLSIAEDLDGQAANLASGAESLALLESRAQSLLSSGLESGKTHTAAVEELVDELDDLMLELRLNS